jgi:dihydroneopterin aldolase
MGTVHIKGLRELGVHGVLPEEQTRPQPFEVDVEMTVDVRAAGESDQLDDTVDYSAVSEAVSRVVRNERYQLLERLATRIAEVCRVDERVTGVRVTVRKLHPPVRAMVDYVAVSIER